MTTLRTTVIMKTDISGSTVRFRALAEAELHALLIEHREFLSRHAAAHDGRIVKPEGDGFWLAFPSVTAAALAAMAMQEELRLAQPNRGDDRLVMRVVITLGDVLHEDGALVGDAVVLTARIESITPPDEIYLSAAACLAVNQAEIRTAFVGTFPLKGFTHSISVYRVEQTHHTRVLEDQYIIFTDLHGFTRFTETSQMTTVEKLLDALLGLMRRVCRKFGGIMRFNTGDAYCLTFGDANFAMEAAESLSEDWAAFLHEEKLSCSVNVAVHRGTLYAFRSYFYGTALNVASRVESASAAVLAPNEGSVFVTGEVRSHLTGTMWDARLDLVDVRPRGHAEVEIYRLGKKGFDSDCP
jgi:class 3 adenylate cyclase